MSILSGILSSTTGRVFLIIISYTVAMQIGFLFEYRNTGACPVWFASAINLLAFYYYPRLAFPGIFAPALINNYLHLSWHPDAMVVSVIMAAGHTVEGYVSAYGTRHITDIFERADDTIYWMFFVVLACLWSAMSGTGAMAIYGIISTVEIPIVFVSWLIGDFTGVIMVVPVVLAWMKWCDGIQDTIRVAFGIIVFLGIEQLLIDLSSTIPLAIVFTGGFVCTTYYLFQGKRHISLMIVLIMSLMLIIREWTDPELFLPTAWALVYVQLVMMCIMLFHFPLILISWNGYSQLLKHPKYFLVSVGISASMFFVVMYAILH